MIEVTNEPTITKKKQKTKLLPSLEGKFRWLFKSWRWIGFRLEQKLGLISTVNSKLDGLNELKK